MGLGFDGLLLVPWKSLVRDWRGKRLVPSVLLLQCLSCSGQSLQLFDLEGPLTRHTVVAAVTDDSRRGILCKLAENTELEGEQPRNWRAGLGFWRTWAGWSNGLAGTSQSARKQIQILHLAESRVRQLSPTPVQAGVWPARKQLCTKQPGGQGGQQAGQEPGMCPCSKEGSQHPGLAVLARM